MDPALRQETWRVEEHHWWFVARRKILLDFIARYLPRSGADILDLGCGSGRLLAALRPLGHLHGLESDPETLAEANQRLGPGTVQRGRLPGEVPFPSESFDLILLFDVLEHIEQDATALRAVWKLLRPGGVLLCTVPALPQLWSAHDVLHQHFRRYSKASLRRLAEQTGFPVQRISYFCTLLFPLVALVRWWHRGHPLTAEKLLKVPAPPLNTLLQATFATERYLLRFANLPLGSSLLLVAEKQRH